MPTHSHETQRLRRVGRSRFGGGLEPAAPVGKAAGLSRAASRAGAEGARAFCRRVDYALPGNLPAVKQPAPATAWAAQLTTLLAWRDDRPYGIEEALATVGPRWVEHFRRGEPLSADDVALLAGTAGLCLSPPQRPSADAWETMLRTYGPLCTLPDDEPPAFSPEGRVVVGIRGDGTPDGTVLLTLDPAAGAPASDRLGAFAAPLRLAHWRADAAAHRGAHGAPAPAAAVSPVAQAKSLRGLTWVGRPRSRGLLARAAAVPDWDRPSAFPAKLRDFWGRPSSRLHHYVWHVARFGAPLRPNEQAAFDRLGFKAPAGGVRAQGTAGAGIDFLGMHRRMLETTRAIAEKLKVPYRPTGWDPIPWNHDDPIWPMPVVPPSDPNAGANKDARVTAAVQRSVKDFFRNPQALARISLDELGNRIEGEIHAWMHMHWSGPTPANLADADPSNDLDSTRNPDWLGFFLSSQVNPIFWKLHGWVDDTIGVWERATGQRAGPLLAQAWLGPVPQAAGLSLARAMEGEDEAHHGGELTDAQAEELLAGLEPPTRTTVVGAEQTREWLAQLVGPDFEPPAELVAAIEGSGAAPSVDEGSEGSAPAAVAASLRDRRVAVSLDRNGARQMGVPVAVEVGLAVFSAATPFMAPGDFQVESADASYRHPGTPPETPTRRTTAEFRLTTFAEVPFPKPTAIEDNQFWFRLMWEHNGADIKLARVEPLHDKSSTLVKSNFKVRFRPAEGSDHADPVAAIRYLISGRWDPFGPGDYGFEGELLLVADGTANLTITHAEGNRVRVVPPLFSNVSRVDLPVPQVTTHGPHVQVFPIDSDALSDADARRALGWLDGLAAPDSALRKELVAGRARVEVHGYASTTGSWDANRKLAERRAERVASLFRTRLPGADVKAIGHGDVEASTPNETEDAGERRVEVWIKQTRWSG